jgi:NIPSNAP
MVYQYNTINASTCQDQNKERLVIYDVTIIGLKPNTYGPVLAKLPAGLARDIRAGSHLGCFMCEFGILNRAFILSQYASMDTLMEDRARSLPNDAFGVGEYLNFIERNAYQPLSFMPDIVPGHFGPFYEIRSYEIASGGMAETSDAWEKVIEQRQKISKLLMVMQSVEAAPQRLLHIWPYKTVNDRSEARAEASKSGIWPPPGSSAHLLSLKSELFVATKFSPLA